MVEFSEIPPARPNAARAGGAATGPRIASAQHRSPEGKALGRGSSAGGLGVIDGPS